MQQAVSFFDVNCTVGRLAAPPPHGPRTVEGLLDALAGAGIERALVCHSQSIEAHPVAGNRRAVEATADHPALRPCWVVLPDTTGEMPPPERLIEQLGAAGVRAVRLCPSAARHQFPIDSADAGRLLGMLARHRVPTLLDSTELPWDRIASLAKAHPLLPLVLLNVGYRAIRTLYPLLETAENVHVEISLYQGCGALREGVGRFGAGRFLFGTGLPRLEPGCAVATVLYADIDEDDKRRIAGANLDRLCREADL